MNDTVTKPMSCIGARDENNVGMNPNVNSYAWVQWVGRCQDGLGHKCTCMGAISQDDMGLHYTVYGI